MVSSFTRPRTTATGSGILDRIVAVLDALVGDLNSSPRIVCFPASIAPRFQGALTPNATIFATTSTTYQVAKDATTGVPFSLTLPGVRKGDRVLATYSPALTSSAAPVHARTKLQFRDGSQAYEGDVERVAITTATAYMTYTETYDVKSDGDLTIYMLVRALAGTASLRTLTTLSAFAVRSPNG